MKDPIKNFVNALYPKGSITQYFGENKELYSKSVCYPPPTGCLQGHNGIDIVAPWGTPIMCVEAGKVVEARSSSDGFGRDVRILSPTDDPHIFREWIYAHLSSYDVKIGDSVDTGQKFCNMGNTGFVVSGSTPYWKYNPYAGTHLHLGVRNVQIFDVMKTWNISYPSGERGTIVNYNNGFFGAVDWIPLYIASKLEEIKVIIEAEPIATSTPQGQGTLTLISTLNSVINLLRKIFSD